MDLQAEWRKTIEEQFPVVKIQTMSRICALVASMTLEEVQQKLDLGAAEHKGEDLLKLDATEALNEEVQDSIGYVALALLCGQ